MITVHKLAGSLSMTHPPNVRFGEKMRKLTGNPRFVLERQCVLQTANANAHCHRRSQQLLRSRSTDAAKFLRTKTNTTAPGGESEEDVCTHIICFVLATHICDRPKVSIELPRQAINDVASEYWLFG